MNETPRTEPPPGPEDGADRPGPEDGTTETDAGREPGRAGFFDWFRSIGIVRGEERWFTGVAGGIAAKAGIDPLIVRGAFVVLALLGGPGILLYLAGWLLLPDSSGRIHAEEILRGRAGTGVTVTAVLLAVFVVAPVVLGFVLGGAPVFGTPSFWGWDFWAAMGVPLWLMRTAAWLFWIAVIAVAAYLVHRAIVSHGRGQAAQSRTESPGQGDATSSDSAHSYAGQAAQWGKQAGEKADEWGRQAGEKAGRWGEEVGRKADEWSARYAEEHDARRLGAPQTILSLALGLLAGAGAAAWAVAAGIAGSLVLVSGLIAGVSVLAISMIVAGVRGRDSGWVGFLALCGVVALLCATFFPSGTRFQPFGNMQVLGGRDAGAVLIAGNTDVDLRGLDDALHPPQEIVVFQVAGNSTVRLPDEHPTLVRTNVLGGRIQEDSASAEGFEMAGPILSHGTGTGLERAADAETTRVTITLIGGDVRITGEQNMEMPR